MNRRDYLKKKAVKNNSLWYHNAYKALRNKINKDVICAKRKHYVKSIEENMGNPKLMWKHLNCLLNRSLNVLVYKPLKLTRETLSRARQ
jgi:hypothetical protein